MESIFEAPLWLLALSVLVVFIGAAVQNLLGMGFGLVASPLLIILDHRLVPAVILMLGMLSSLPGATVNVKLIVWKHVWVALLARLAGSALAAWVIVIIGDTGSKTFSAVFAGTLFCAVALSAIPGRLARIFRVGYPSLSIAGFVSGLTGTITSVGGPPLALVYRTESHQFARSHLNISLFVGAGISLAALAYAGFVGKFQLQAFLALCPFTILGLWCSSKFHDVAGRHFKDAVLVMVTIAACVVLWRSL